MAHQLIRQSPNGFIVNKIPEDPVEAGIVLHSLLAKGKEANDGSLAGVLNGLCERFSLTADHVKGCIQAFIHAQDVWMKENVSEWVTLMIRNDGDMDCEEAKAFVYNGLPGHRIESSTAYAMFRAEVNSAGYNFQKSLEKGRLTSS